MISKSSDVKKIVLLSYLVKTEMVVISTSLYVTLTIS